MDEFPVILTKRSTKIFKINLSALMMPVVWEEDM